MVRRGFSLSVIVAGFGLVAAAIYPIAVASGAPSTNVRVTVDTGSAYVSADALGGTGGTSPYSDATLTKCGTSQRPQNEPTIAIDPRNTAVRTSGANDYCTVETNHDAWAGFYRSADAGVTWTDSLLPGYQLDKSPQALASPLHQMVLSGATAAGDPVQSWDMQGNLFYMGNNFSRGVPDGNSANSRGNIGDVWVATYAQAPTGGSSTDGSLYVRTVILATNTSGLGSFNDKTAIGVDPVNGDVFAAWSRFHGSGCNEIDVAHSTDHGATFSAPLKVSSSLCGNQGPNFAFGPLGQVYLAWQASNGGSKGLGTQNANGIGFVSSTDYGATFSAARLALTFNPFGSGQFSGNGARECGDAPFNCPTGFTFPRFDLAAPTITADGSRIVMAFQVALVSGQGQIQSTWSSDGGATWSKPTAIDAHLTDHLGGHQFFPWLTSAHGKIYAVYYDSRLDPNYAATRPPCNDANGVTNACLAVWSSTSTDGGSTWTTHAQVTDQLTNPNLEQFGGRKVAFFGDYIEVSAVSTTGGTAVAAVWTDQRDAKVGTEIATSDNDKADVAGSPETTGVQCTTSLDNCFDGTGGLNQNIYTASLGG
jgi:hypothetical protein